LRKFTLLFLDSLSLLKRKYLFEVLRSFDIVLHIYIKKYCLQKLNNISRMQFETNVSNIVMNKALKYGRLIFNPTLSCNFLNNFSLTFFLLLKHVNFIKTWLFILS